MTGRTTYASALHRLVLIRPGRHYPAGPRVSRGLWLLGVVAALVAMPAQAQINPNRPSRQLGRALRQTLQTGRFGAAPGMPTGNRGRSVGRGGVNASAAAVAFQGNARAASTASVFLPNTRSVNRGSGSMLARLGQSPSAYFFAFPSYAGRSPGQPAYRPFMRSTAVRLGAERPVALAEALGFHHRVHLHLFGGGIRDELTTLSLETLRRNNNRNNTFKTTPFNGGDSFEVRPFNDGGSVEVRPFNDGGSVEDRLSARIDARRGQLVKAGWEHLRAGNFLRASGTFESASLLDDDVLETRVGKFLSAVAGEQHSIARVLLDTIASRHDDMFSVTYSLADVLPAKPEDDRASLRDRILTGWAASVQAAPEKDHLAAIQIYLLWLDGQRREALEAADALRDEFRASPYAAFGQHMRAQVRREEETGEQNTDAQLTTAQQIAQLLDEYATGPEVSTANEAQ